MKIIISSGISRLGELPYDEVAGIVAGASGNPAILAFANTLAPTDIRVGPFVKTATPHPP